MTPENIYERIRHVLHITTKETMSCKHCHEHPKGFVEAINHYIGEHGYKLLHVGSELGVDRNEKPCHHTVAVLGI